MEVELIAVTKYLRGNGTPEELLEHAGRVCYRSEKQGEAGKFLQARIREGHESIIEHASLTFEVSGISRACTHQLVRHRIASYSQESQRYVDLSDPELVVPPSIAQNPEAMRIWDDLAGRMKRYNGAPSGHPHCLDIGCARQGVPSGQRSELCRAAHAEQNAINFAARCGIGIEGATLYTTHYPCSWCAKSIVNAGIARVIYDEDYPDPLAKEILSAIWVQPIRTLPNTETGDYAPSENSSADQGNGN